MFAWAGAAPAGIVVGGTRVIFRANEGEVTLHVTNTGQKPSLVQTWIDTGNSGVSPDQIDVPFTLTPVMFRLDPAKGQTLRIIQTGASTDVADRESLYWLNILEIPPRNTSAQEGEEQLQLAFRTRLKLMYRPAGLEGRAEEAPAQVLWQLVRREGGYALKADNPTAFHVNLGSVDLVVDGRHWTAGSGYVRPMDSETFVVRALPELPVGTLQVEYRAINDFGAGVLGQAPVARSSAD